MTAVTRQALLLVLENHIGRERGITARELVREICGTWSSGAERQLRSQVEQLREDGIAICAHPSDGYFVARDVTELQASIRFLRQRALTSLRQIRQLKKLAAPDMHGQRRLML